MKITPLFSGSSGNSTLVSTGSSNILIDVGRAEKHMDQALWAAGSDVSRISAILITHEHRDHIAGLKGILKRRDVPVYATAGTWSAVLDRVKGLPSPRYREVRPGEVFHIGGAALRAFAIPHDAAQPVGYRIDAEGHSFSLATDIGQVLPEWLKAVRGSEAVMLECNYNEELLAKSDKPDFCKERVRSEKGHLSNEECAAALVDLVRAGARHVWLGHMSTTSNNPQLARRVVCQIAEAAGLGAGKDFSLDVADRYEVSRSVCL